MNLKLMVGKVLSSTSSDYEVQGLLGSGAFGAVAQCRKLSTNETVALKIIKRKNCIEDAKDEEVVLQTMKALGSEKFNIVRWNESFTFQGHFCLEFEKLDISLHQFLESNKHQGLVLKEIRPVVQQLATALDFLRSCGIVHADIKPANIMMVDHLLQPLRVKLIDFGLAFKNPEAWTGATVQTLWYRSPEVLLGAPFNQAIDVWSVGCTAAEMLMGTTLFPGSDESDMIRNILHTVGKPPDQTLNGGLYTKQFFFAKGTGQRGQRGQRARRWMFKPTLKMRRCSFPPRTIASLANLQKQVSVKTSAEDAKDDECDRASFVDLLSKMLKVDASERITPKQVLQHPFIVLSQLDGPSDSSYQDLSPDKARKAAARSSSSSDTLTRNKDGPVGLSSREKPTLHDQVVSGGNHPGQNRKRPMQSVPTGDTPPTCDPGSVNRGSAHL
ncbi:homeodomain-interacting protein kinase 1-like [Embiotoca jacksoni]|uniref:homeodomain-interacting protein kinase 1-like n=1 Tax=Embiotoca jacksoni TaxID=100190 RepID=UPI003703ADBB